MPSRHPFALRLPQSIINTPRDDTTLGKNPLARAHPSIVVYLTAMYLTITAAAVCVCQPPSSVVNCLHLSTPLIHRLPLSNTNLTITSSFMISELRLYSMLYSVYFFIKVHLALPILNIL